MDLRPIPFELHLPARPSPGALTRRLGLLLLLLVGLGGCARYYWSNPAGTAEQFDRDNRECAREASAPGSAALGVVNQAQYRGCLTARGWVRDKQFEPVPPGWYRGIE